MRRKSSFESGLESLVFLFSAGLFTCLHFHFSLNISFSKIYFSLFVNPRKGRCWRLGGLTWVLKILIFSKEIDLPMPIYTKYPGAASKFHRKSRRIIMYKMGTNQTQCPLDENHFSSSLNLISNWKICFFFVFFVVAVPYMVTLTGETSVSTRW